jgi:hypothetical protein
MSVRARVRCRRRSKEQERAQCAVPE